MNRTTCKVIMGLSKGLGRLAASGQRLEQLPSIATTGATPFSQLLLHHFWFRLLIRFYGLGKSGSSSVAAVFLFPKCLPRFEFSKLLVWFFSFLNSILDSVIFHLLILVHSQLAIAVDFFLPLFSSFFVNGFDAKPGELLKQFHFSEVE